MLQFNSVLASICFQSKTIAEQLAEKLNARLGYRPPTEDEQGLEGGTNADTFKRSGPDYDMKQKILAFFNNIWGDNTADQ